MMSPLAWHMVHTFKIVIPPSPGEQWDCDLTPLLSDFKIHALCPL